MSNDKAQMERTTHGSGVDNPADHYSTPQIVDTGKSDIQLQARCAGFTLVVTTAIGLLNTFISKPRSFDSRMLIEYELQFRAAQIPKAPFATQGGCTHNLYCEFRHLIY